MGMLFFLLLVGAVGAGFWYLRRKAAADGRTGAVQPNTAAARALANTPVHTTERRPGRMVRSCEDACAAVRRIESVWYPDAGCPRLPLEACGHPTSCRCSWMRVLDRRVTHRRVQPDRRGSVRFEEKADRREGPDRRADSGDRWKQAP